MNKKILAAGIIVAGIAISKGEYRERIAYAIDTYSKDFPMVIVTDIKNRIDVNMARDIPLERIMQSYSHPEELFPYSETGGIVYMHDGDIRFLQLRSRNEVLAREILDNREDETRLEYLIKENLDLVKIVIETTPDDLKRTIRDYLIDSADCYLLDEGLLREELNPFLGRRLIGHYHIHPYAEPPSEDDLINSRKTRVFVIVNQKEGYMAYDLKGGRINQQISYTSPSP